VTAEDKKLINFFFVKISLVIPFMGPSFSGGLFGAESSTSLKLVNYTNNACASFSLSSKLLAIQIPFVVNTQSK
jgi:hypothetical protein